MFHTRYTFTNMQTSITDILIYHITRFDRNSNILHKADLNRHADIEASPPQTPVSKQLSSIISYSAGCTNPLTWPAQFCRDSLNKSMELGGVTTGEKTVEQYGESAKEGERERGKVRRIERT